MGSKFAVFGAGMQGSAVAYDLARYANPEQLSLYDAREEAAMLAARRVNGLVGRGECEGSRLDAGDPLSLRRVLPEFDVAVSCLPYRLHQMLERACLEAGVSVVDMGNDTDVTLETLSWDADARAKGITILPDTGLAPGLVNSLANVILERMDEVETIRLYCGGLPQVPNPPLNYALSFSIEGLVGEYVDEAIALRDGQVLRLQTLEELEEVYVRGFGALEAFTTSSGTSTAPWTRQGQVRNYEYKTLRYPGHCAIMQAFRNYGFWDEEPVDVGGVQIPPITMFYKLMGERLREPEYRDVVVTVAMGEGTHEGKPSQMEIVLIDRFDEATGFSAMERLTGFSTAICAAAVARGEVRKGCVRYEEALSGERFLELLAERGIVPEIRWTSA